MCHLIYAVDRERRAIAAAFGLDLPPVDEAFHRAGKRDVGATSTAGGLEESLAAGAGCDQGDGAYLSLVVRDALERLAELIRAAMVEPKVRKKTRPTRASKERRIETKKRRGDTKQGRGARGWD